MFIKDYTVLVNLYLEYDMIEVKFDTSRFDLASTLAHVCRAMAVQSATIWRILATQVHA